MVLSDWPGSLHCDSRHYSQFFGLYGTNKPPCCGGRFSCCNNRGMRNPSNYKFVTEGPAVGHLYPGYLICQLSQSPPPRMVTLGPPDQTAERFLFISALFHSIDYFQPTHLFIFASTQEH